MQDRAAETAVNRRAFLQVGAAAASAAAVATGTTAAVARDDKPADDKVLMTRKLGKTGVDVTILTQGTWRAPGLDRLLRFSYANGVRYYDTAQSYGSEPGFKRWFQQQPEVRKEIFLVTKDHPRQPEDLFGMVDTRLDALGTDYIDLLFIHALGDSDTDAQVKWPKDPRFGKTIEKIKATGKVKFVGFSTHHPRRPEIIANAAEGGFVDAIMLQYTPWLDKDSPLNKALDAAHAKGIGLVSMKQVAGNFAAGGEGNILGEVARRVPALKERGLSPYQGLLQAIWSDERIASACVSMRNTDQIRENSEAARKFAAEGPLKEADIRDLRDACLAARPTLCADCDGRCAHAAGTKARLGDLTRYLTYHEHHGYRGEARKLYAELTDAERNWTDADLAAARDACPSQLDFAALLPKADRLLG